MCSLHPDKGAVCLYDQITVFTPAHHHRAYLRTQRQSHLSLSSHVTPLSNRNRETITTPAAAPVRSGWHPPVPTSVLPHSALPGQLPRSGRLPRYNHQPPTLPHGSPHGAGSFPASLPRPPAGLQRGYHPAHHPTDHRLAQVGAHDTSPGPGNGGHGTRKQPQHQGQELHGSEPFRVPFDKTRRPLWLRCNRGGGVLQPGHSRHNHPICLRYHSADFPANPLPCSLDFTLIYRHHSKGTKIHSSPRKTLPPRFQPQLKPTLRQERDFHLFLPGQNIKTTIRRFLWLTDHPIKPPGTARLIPAEVGGNSPLFENNRREVVGKSFVGQRVSCLLHDFALAV